MPGKSTTSIKSLYKAKIHSCSNSSKSSSKRSLDSNNYNSAKIPRTSSDRVIDVVTLDESEDEDALTDRFAPIIGALPFDEKTFNAPKDASKSNLLSIFFLKSPYSDTLRSAYSSLSREVFNPRWIDISEVDKMASTHKNPILVLESFESDEFSTLKSKKSLKIFSAFALLSINPRRPEDLISFKHTRIASVCMKKVSLTYSGIADHSVVSEIRSKTRAMGGIFKPGLHSKTTHIISTHWKSEKVKCFRKKSKPVMRPEWLYRCWELREEIRDLAELDEFTLPVFAGMNICVSGFDQKTRTKMEKIVVENGGRWQSGLMLDRYDFDTEGTVYTQIEKNQKTTHLVVAAKTGDKYKAAMSDPEVKIVNLDWFNISVINGIPQMEDDARYCLRDKSALDELKRSIIENKKRQLQSCSQIDPTPNRSLLSNVFISIDELVLNHIVL